MAVELIYCAGGNPAFRRAATEAGWLNGARLPDTVYDPPLHFADQHYRRPDRAAYMRALAAHRPAVATVLDWEEPGQFAEVLSWAEEAAQYCQRIIIIPKVPGAVPAIPERIGQADVILGYSVPTSYGGSPLGLWEFGRRPVHLLGGSPQRQLETARYLRVVSADGSMAQQQARSCRHWSRRPGPKGHWRQLGTSQRDGAHLEAFSRSLQAIREAWAS